MHSPFVAPVPVQSETESSKVLWGFVIIMSDDVVNAKKNKSNTQKNMSGVLGPTTTTTPTSKVDNHRGESSPTDWFGLGWVGLGWVERA